MPAPTSTHPASVATTASAAAASGRWCWPLWHNPYWGQRNYHAMARHLLDRGADYSITVAAALGDETRVKDLLGGSSVKRPTRSEACGKRPLSAAAERGHGHIVRLLLQTGADPNPS